MACCSALSLPPLHWRRKKKFRWSKKFVATNCKASAPKCGEELVGENPSKEKFYEPKAEITKAEAEAEGEVQAGGRVPYGVTDFKVLTVPGGKYSNNTVEPTLRVTHIRTDVAPGLATNPFAVPQCTTAAFGTELVPTSGFFTAPSPAEASEGGCGESKIGTQEATVYGGPFGDLALSGTVYDLVPGGEETLENGQKLAALYGVALKLPQPITSILLAKGFKEKEEKGAKPGEGGFPTKKQQEELEAVQYYAHTLIKGSVEWGKEARGKNIGDFHDFFEIEVSPELPLIRSRLSFEGQVGDGGFITNATSCPGHLTTTLKVTDLEGKEAPAKEFTTPIGLEGCEEVEFAPKFNVAQGNTLSDSPSEFSTEAVEEHEPEETDVSQVKSASFVLPEGMTLNPSAAAGLEACTVDQAHQVEGGIFGEQFGVECPVGSKIGTVDLNVPTLPDGSLKGSVYLASGSKSATITNPPYDIYVVANSAKYGVSVRLFGETVPNPVTGQVTTYFNTPPEQPFTSLKLTFERGVLTPLANPLLCGEAKGSATFEPTSAPGTHVTDAFGVNITGCASSPPPFVLTQSAENENETAGAHTSYSFSLGRSDGNGYLKTIKTVLPLGLVGAIPDVTQCEEAQANAGTCSAASKIGTVSVLAGSGSSPYPFNGTVYLTGPYNGAPYGMSIVVPANAGPFALGNVVTRATLNINPTTAQVTAESQVPTIYKGIPLRLRSIDVDINRQGFLYNPTNCTPQATTSTLTSTEGAVQSGLSTPFTVTGCEKLPLAPKFGAQTSANVSRVNGVGLTTTLTQLPGESNIKSVKVQLPRNLPSRDSTLKQACLQATFESGPGNCPKGSNVGTVEITTPTLPGTMKGNAYFVSHGGAAFPDLDLVAEAPSTVPGQGVKVILVGNTDITNNITTTTFASTPDVPVSSVIVRLPAKSNSAVGGYGDLCRNPLYMPTTITGQNGKVTKLNPVIAVSGCGVKVVGQKVVGHTAYLTVQTFAAGRISGSGSGVKSVARTLGAATRAATLKVQLSSSGARKHKPLRVKIRVGFLPKGKGAHSIATVTVTFR